MSNSKLTIILALALLIIGCVGPKEAMKGFLGVSTRELELARKDAVKKSFDINYDLCNAKTLELLNKIKASVYAKDIKNGMIAIYVSETDTTSVGIFFNKLSAGRTEIEVTSRSTYFKNMISQKLFAALEKEINPVK
jgi:hypothetical protein